MKKIYLRSLLTSLAAIFLSLNLSLAQTVSVKGTVTDANGTLVGVSVMEMNAGAVVGGTTTDANGQYTLSVGAASTLEFSYIGYETVTREVGTATTIDVEMKADAEMIEDVVVVGYGVQKKSHLTGSVSKIDGGILADNPVSDITTALQGQISGLSVNNDTSEVGVSPSIRVRGTGSISADSSPLIIIDGYPVPDGLSMLNPSDIESIEILKDASSAAIYGSRAANGVIMVTTKAGSADDPNYSVKFYSGIKNAYKLHDMMTNNEYYYMRKKEAELGGKAVTTTEKVGAYIERNTGATNWQEVGLRDLATITNLQVSVSGGSKATKYYASASYTADEGLMLENAVQKLTFRTRLETELSKRVKMGVNVTGTYQHTQRPKNNFIDFYRTPALMPVEHNAWTTALTGYTGFARGSHFNGLTLPVGGDIDDVTDTTAWPTLGSSSGPFTSSNNNPYCVMANTNRWAEAFSGLGNMYFTVDIAKGLQFKTSNGFNAKISPSYYYAKENAMKDNQASEAEYFQTTYIDMLSENTLSYNATWGDHGFSALLGYTAQKTRVQRVALSATGFPSDDIETLSAATVFELASEGNGNGKGTGTFRYPNEVLESVLSRVNYDYKGKYLLSASIRLDRSSLFTEGNRNAYFPSVSAGWRISEEDFMKGQDAVSNLKLRASYGVTGNNQVDYDSTMETLSGQNYSFGSGTGSLTAGMANTSSTLSNYYLTWEQTDEYNLGLEMGFIDNKINLSADAYYSITRALLFEQPTQSFTGYTSFWNNIGKVRNMGLEFQIDTYNINHKNFKWQTTANLSLSRNRLLELGGEAQLINSGERSENYIAVVGEPLIQYYGYKTNGVWNTTEEINANPSLTGDAPGDLRIVDTNHDDVINEKDRVALGTPYPDFTWGMTNSFKIYNFDASFLLQGVQGVTVFNGDCYYNETLRWNRAYTDNRWISAEHPGDGQTPFEKNSYSLLTDWPLEDASYLCLRNVTVGYTLPKHITKSLHISGLRVYVSGNNLLYLWSDDYRGVNPEARYNSGNYSSPMISGYQRGGFPLTSTYTAGIDLKF